MIARFNIPTPMHFSFIASRISFVASPADALVYDGAMDFTDRTHGLDLYDSEARWYDSLLGRTTTMDPKSEKYYSLSPYLWCAGNPVRFVDPDGNNAIVVVDGKEITIRVNIYIQGASEELIKQYYDNIMQNWGVYTNYTDILTGDIYSLKWDINVQSVMSQDDVDFDNPANNYYLAIRGKSKVIDTNRGKIRTDFSVRPNPMAHEFGHNLGLIDRYENDDYYAVPHSKGNIMAEEAGKGVVSVSNIQTIVQPALFDHSIRNFGRKKRKTIYYINKQIREPFIRKHK